MRVPIAIPNVVPLFLPMRHELIRLLNGLTDEQWNLPTACAGWNVRDVALHILGDDIGLLSGLRDQDSPPGRFDAFADLVSYINARNAAWIEASRRMSRTLLLSLLANTGAQWVEYATSVDPTEPSGPIGWTGNKQDSMELHIAREYTEFWMHHQHISEAIGVVSLRDETFLHAALSTFIYCLPRIYRIQTASKNTLVKVVISNAGGGTWHLVREEERWALYDDTDLEPTSTVQMTADMAWRLFTKGIDQTSIQTHIQIVGDQTLGQIMWNAVAIIA